MAPSGEPTTVLDRCLATPPPGLVSRMSLRLSFFDVLWLHAPPVQRLVFYEIPEITKTNFIEEIIPKLRDSLNLTLKYYIPLAGNLIIPPNSGPDSPEILYKRGNSVPLIVAESNAIDFEWLVANHARDSSDFHCLVPKLVQSTDDSGSILSSVLALQVTLFPNMGFSIGITSHQAAGDACTIFRFSRIWAFHAKAGEAEAEEKVNAPCGGPLGPPCYYRTIIKDPKGLSSIFWNQWNNISKLDRGSGISSNSYKVRQTFLISPEQVENIRKLVPTMLRGQAYMKSFKVVCAYVWICLVKSRGEEAVDEEEVENFVCFGNCRRRLDHLVAENYFGNCITLCIAKMKNGELVGGGGIPRAVGLIGAAMNEKLQSQEALSNGAENWLVELQNLNLDRTFVVAGSPKFNFYQLDFGWGRPRRFEFVSIDKTGAVSLCGGRDRNRDIEVGLSLPKARMDAFAAIFNQGLKDL
ncbi:phenolic glucoside malonyltransferase 1-like [Coffea arabica]|uniref:Phenolic glucoside malonyltransferase 1-like n=1 Tax=Coffea arabica TaxID=13443 RepID=A0A6P6SCU8_COFAR|nr:anthocyanin 5-aromatic acyltransferase-like [Coffea arabica]